MKVLAPSVFLLLVACAPDAVPTGPWLRETTETSGVRFMHDAARTPRKYMPEIMGSGIAAFDADGDGDPDLLCLQSGPVPGGGASPKPGASRGPALFLNRGDGTFDAAPSALPPITPCAFGVACADYDGDGRVDVFIAALGGDVLLRNRGDGTFEDVTRSAGISEDAWGHAAAWFDADRDGDLDLYVVNYVDFSTAKHRDCGDPSKGRVSYCHPDAWPSSPDVLWRNRGDGTFEDATRALGFDDRDGKGLGTLVGDFDGDGSPEVYVANDSTPNFLWRRGPDGRYEDVAIPAGCALSEDGRTEAGMGVAAGDVNADGRIDILVTNLTRESNSLYLSTPTGDFDEASRVSGLFGISWKWVGFGCDLVDYDNDGDLDLHVVNGHVLDDPEATDDAVPFRQPFQLVLNDGTGRFSEVPADRLGDYARPDLGRGTCTLDFDGDGRPDMAVATNDGPVRLFRNTLPSRGEWIGLTLKGRAPNTGAVGARVTVMSAGREFIREVRAGGSYGSSHESRIHVGLGEAEGAVDVRVVWPDGSRSTHRLAPGAYRDVPQPR